MTSEEFILWLKGFVKAANSYNITPKQWEDIVDTLNTVNVKQNNSFNVKYDLDKTNHT